MIVTCLGCGHRYRTIEPKSAVSCPDCRNGWGGIKEGKMQKAWDEGEERMEAIGPNGPTGDHYDAVDRPEHYQSEAGIECIDAIRAALGREGFIAHCRGTAIKYAWRSGKKAAHAEDLHKACVYLTWAAEALEEAAE